MTPPHFSDDALRLLWGPVLLVALASLVHVATPPPAKMSELEELEALVSATKEHPSIVGRSGSIGRPLVDPYPVAANTQHQH